MQSPGFKIGMNETALGTGVPYWIKVSILLCFPSRFIGRIFLKDLMVRTVGQRQAELAFQLSILFDPQSALKVIFKSWLTFAICWNLIVAETYLDAWQIVIVKILLWQIGLVDEVAETREKVKLTFPILSLFWTSSFYIMTNLKMG